MIRRGSRKGRTGTQELAYDSGRIAKYGDVRLFHDGKAVGEGCVEQTQGFIFSADETTDIGYESGTAVTPDQRNAHTSKLNGCIDFPVATTSHTKRAALF